MIRLVLAAFISIWSYSLPAEAGTPPLVVIGDSMAEGTIPHLGVPNKSTSIRGASIDDRWTGLVDDIAPGSNVVVMLGTNETAGNYANFRTRVNTLLRRIADRRPAQIIWVGPPCSVKPNVDVSLMRVNEALSYIMFEWRTRHEPVPVHFVSLRKRTLDADGKTCKPANREIDGQALHFTPDGYKDVAALIRESL